MIDSVRCEVLNVTYEPLGYVSARRGLRMYLEGKAVVLEEHPTYFASSVNDIFPLPTRVVLNRLVKGRSTTRTVAQVTQRNLFLRDNQTCQYCGRHKSELRGSEILTRDHIIPQDRGGKDTWENLVTACNLCNNKKANMSLEEFEMKFPNLKLRKEPAPMTIYEVHSRAQAQRNRNRSM